MSEQVILIEPIISPTPSPEPTPIAEPTQTPEPNPIPELTESLAPIPRPPTPKPDSNFIPDVIELTLVELIKKYIENEEMSNKLNIKLTPEIISIINNIITLTPDTLTDIEKCAIEIIKDGKIDTKDIPNLIIIIQRIYQFIYSLKSVKFDYKRRADITASSLKYLIHFFVLERRIKIDEEKQAEFLTQTDALIDSCVGLLSFSKSIKTNGCIKKIFG